MLADRGWLYKLRPGVSKHDQIYQIKERDMVDRIITGSVMIDGVEYVPKQSHGDIKIVVLDRGFVYVGRVTEKDDRIEVSDAKNIIRWGTSKHIAELYRGPLENTRLGDSCSFIAYRHNVIHIINVDQDAWDNVL